MALAPNTEIIQQAVDNLVEQFRDSTQLHELLKVYVQQVKDIEDAVLTICTITSFNDSEGVNLDTLGNIIGEERFSRSDADYRLALQTRILLNTSSGTIEELIAIIQSILGGVSIDFREYFPAAFIAEITTPIDPTQVNLESLKDFIRSAKAAGVRCEVHVKTTGAFQFDSGPGYDIGKYAVTLV